MKMLNVIITFDVYCLAENGEPAIEAVMELIRNGEISPSYTNAIELRASPVRPQWRDERPIVAGDVSDADFERIKGKTTQEVHDLLTKKQPAAKDGSK